MRFRHLAAMATLAVAALALLGGTAWAGAAGPATSRPPASVALGDVDPSGGHGGGHDDTAAQESSGDTNNQHGDMGGMPALGDPQAGMPGHADVPGGVTEHGNGVGAPQGDHADMSGGTTGHGNGGAPQDVHGVPGHADRDSAAPGEGVVADHGDSHASTGGKDRLRASLIGGFVVVNALVLLVAAVLRRRPRYRRPVPPHPARPRPVSPTA